jgi:hypothetical protein
MGKELDGHHGSARWHIAAEEAAPVDAYDEAVERPIFREV